MPRRFNKGPVMPRRFNKDPEIEEFDVLAFGVFSFCLWAAGFCTAASIFAP